VNRLQRPAVEFACNKAIIAHHRIERQIRRVRIAGVLKDA
jgi:hypothetical protein